MKTNIFSSVDEWVFDEALPLWAAHGIDHENGGFVECLTENCEDAQIPFKRTRVTCRQIYVFSHAAILGYPDAKPCIEHGVDHLMNVAWLGDGKGYARKVTRSGEVMDATPDLYDYAFALFALSWAYRALKREDIREFAHKTLDHIEQLLSHASGVGYWHDATKEGWRQQNPHMHLLEALLVASDAIGDQRYKTLAATIMDLFCGTFYDAERGMLPEFFDDNWQPAPGLDGTFFEPGHQMEWAWILKECHKILGIKRFDVIRNLVKTAERYGVEHATGKVYNKVNVDGTVRDAGCRTWPHTERIKSAVALYEIDGTDPMPVFENCCKFLFSTHLDCEPAGIWVDQYCEDGKSIVDTVPTSTLYHVILAFLEMLRVGEDMGRYKSRNFAGGQA